jgi:hypothetical protein
MIEKNGNQLLINNDINNPQFGFYEYRNKFYFDKFQLLDEALHNKDYNPLIKYNFNDNVYSKIDWEIEPKDTLSNIYKYRAKQLRDTYDYLILMYSGGSDSHQILHTFLENDIFIDEVQTVYPEKLASRMNIVNDRHDGKAFVYEHELTTIPGFKNIHKTSPKTKLTLIDMSDDLIEFCKPTGLSDNYWTDYSTGSQHGIYRPVQANCGLNYNRKNVEGKGKVGIIYGLDKPKLMIRNNKLFCYFVDIARTGAQASQRPTNNINFNIEMFFSTPDFPLIHVKQAHIIKKFIEKSSIIYNNFIGINGNSPNQLKIGEIIKNIIYPTWTNTIFQSAKGDQGTWDFEKPFFDFIEPKMSEMILNRKKMIIEKYSKFNINKHSVGLMIIYSPFYFVGDINLQHDLFDDIKL